MAATSDSAVPMHFISSVSLMRPAPLSTDLARTLRCCSHTARSSDSISASSGVGLPSFAARISNSISAAASAP